MKHILINADVIEGLRKLPDKSVHTVVTSPPYWAVRDYGIDGQLGLESTVDEYLRKMVEVFREVKRVLRDDGTLWLNLGDKYSTSNPVGRGDTELMYPKNSARLRRGSFRRDKEDVIPNRFFRYDLPEKNLMMIPARVAIALQDNGWILRSEIIWHKPNAMPESVIDRPTKAHEQIFLFSKNPRYFYDAEAVRQEQTGNAHSKGTGTPPKTADPKSKIRANSSFHKAISKKVDLPTGKNLRTVWTIATQSRPDAHFATFPDELARRCILAGTSEYGCCPHCGAAWKRIVKAEGGTIGQGWHDHSADMQKGQKAPPGSSFKDYKRTTLGWKPSCSCEENIPIPCTVLDPFGGSGTVADISREQNRSSILIEINPDYIDLQKQRLRINEQLNTGLCSIEVIT